MASLIPDPSAPDTASASASAPAPEPPRPGITVRRVDYADAREAQALVELLDGYAQDVAGGGEPLRADVKRGLAQALAQRPHAFSVMAWVADPAATGGEIPVGLVNCIEGFSTFACKPLVNVHDVAVAPAWRGHRIAQRMLQAVEAIALERGACKLTMEVLSGNRSALRAYEREGFAAYTLDPGMGQALFLQKLLAPGAQGTGRGDGGGGESGGGDSNGPAASARTAVGL